MTNKRYFEKEYDEVYYIFDSEDITEEEFDAKEPYDDFHIFEKSMIGNEVVDKLNELHEKNKELESKIYELIQYYQDEEIHATESWYELMCSAKQEVLHELLTETGS